MTILRENTQYIVEAGTGIEPVYTDLQWNVSLQTIVLKHLYHLNF